MLVDRYGNSIADNQQVTLWTGNTNSYSGSMTLSDDVSNYITLYFVCDAYIIEVPILSGESTLYGSAVRDYRYASIRITSISGSSLKWDGQLWVDQSNNSGLVIKKVIGIKKL